jgi:hypothetical protein
MFKMILTPLAMAILLAKKAGAFAGASTSQGVAATIGKVGRLVGTHQPLSETDLPSLESALSVWMNRDDAGLVRVVSKDHPLSAQNVVELSSGDASAADSQSSPLAVDASTPK